MKEEELKKILDILKSEFLKENVDLDEVCAKLYLSGHVTDSENDWIKLSKNKTEKFIMMFDTLKQKPKEIFKRLQQICIEMGLSMLYELIQSDLEKNFCHLNMTKEEFNSYHDTNVESLYYDIEQPTKDFVGREDQLMELHGHMQRHSAKSQGEAKAVVIVEKSATITGLGGIGKTQLALKYVEQYRREYGNKILWINAESELTLRDSFLRLADYLELNTRIHRDLAKETADIAKDVYAHFSKLQCLFVFDNANATIPDNLFPSGPQHKIYILITSRYQMWGKIKTFQLDNLTLKEAVKFIKQALTINDGDIEEKCVEKLANMLHCFPLALNQATAYITETNKTVGNSGSCFTITEYLELYKEKKEDLLKYKFFTDVGNESSQTTYTTWSITIKKIQESENGVLALTILNMISYLGSKNIDPKIFSPLNNNFEVGSAIKLLKQYSMVKPGNDMLHIHPLIQEVTRLNLKQKNTEEETFTSTSQLTTSHFEQLMSLQAYAQFRQLLEHMEIILQAVKAWLQNNPSDRKRMEQTIIKNLLKFMFNGYFEISESRQTKLILEQLLDIETEQYGHVQVAIILTHLGNAYEALDNYEKAKILLERSLAIQEKHYGLDHFQVAITLTSLGCAFGHLGNQEKKKTLLERSLAIEEKHYGLDHFQVAITLTSLGCAYGYLGDNEKMKTLLERSLAIEEKHYGLDHFQVAITLTYLGCAFGYLGDSEKKRSLLERALEIKEKHYGLDHFAVAITLTNLGNAYGALGNHEKEKILLEKSLAIQEKYYGHDHFQVAITLGNLGNAYGALGNHEKEKILLEKSLAIQEKYYGHDHFQVAITLGNLGNAYGALGNHEKEKILLERSLAIQEKYYGHDHFAVAITLANLGCAYGALGNHEKKKTLLERSLAIQEKHYVNGNDNVLITLKNLSDAYSKLEEHANEKDILKRILVIQGKHYGIFCDGCQNENFTGCRYKCLVCSNYDLCSTCFVKMEETQNHKSVHEMMCIGNAE